MVVKNSLTGMLQVGGSGIDLLDGSSCAGFACRFYCIDIVLPSVPIRYPVVPSYHHYHQHSLLFQCMIEPFLITHVKLDDEMKHRMSRSVISYVYPLFALYSKEGNRNSIR